MIKNDWRQQKIHNFMMENSRGSIVLNGEIW